jgi:UDP:flavonoid glycosyltransferase YjiC (YdhE family)
MLMRVLFSTNYAAGHWHPLIPFAAALRETGHDVAFAAAPATCAEIAALGFRCFAAGHDGTAAEVQERLDRVATLSETDFVAWIWTNRFGGKWAAGRLPDLLAIIAEWQPAVLVREDMEFAGCIAAERCGLPHAAVQVTAWRPWLHILIVESLNRLRVQTGLPPDPDLLMLSRFLLIVPTPPSYQDPANPLPPTAHAIRHFAFDRSGNEPLPAWVHALPDRPVVYATMGTYFNRVPGVHAAILEGLHDEPVSLILTVGRDQDPANFGSQPPHIHIARYIPQSLLFPHCDLVVNHGGSGTVMSALGHGLPMVIIPVSADQPDNARRCQQLGVAQVIPPEERTPEAIREGVCGVLGNPTYRQNAQRLQQELAELPPPEHVAGWLERLATDPRPLTAVL